MNRDRTPAAASPPTPPARPQPLLRVARPPCTALAVDFLRAGLRSGERSREEVMRAAAQLGLTAKMIRAARERVGVVVERRGFPSHAYWRLPARPADAQTGQSNQESAPCR